MSNVDLLAAAPDYLKTYSLSCEPFANNLDGRFFYGGSALMQRLDLLTHLTQFGDSVILVSGPRGSGKTTLLGRFAGQASQQWRLCLINADEFDQFQQRLGDALGISDAEDVPQMLERWASQTEASQLLVVVIDNSEQLQPDAFQRLCAALLKPPLAERVRLILFGTPEAQQALKQSFDHKELPCSAQLLEVPRLTEEETASYLMYRLAVAGYSGESPFTATEVRALCKAADGRPANINQLAHEALLEHQIRVAGKQPGKPKTVRKGVWLIWGLSSLLVVGFGTYLGWQRLQPTPPTEATLADNLAHPVEEIPLDLPQPVAPQVPGTKTGELTGPPQSPATELPTAADMQPPPAVDELPATPPPPPATPGPETAKKPETEPPMPATVPPPEPPVTQQPLPAQVPVTPPTPTEAVPATTPVASAPAEGETETAAEPATGVVESVAPTPAPAADLPHREAWLLQQPGQNYSLQLLGSRSAESIADYIEQHHLDQEKCAFYRGNYKGGKWYVLMYGLYPSRQAALEARAGLPARVRKDNPWPRTLKSVHTAIRDAQ